MFVVALGINGQGRLVNQEWKRLRVDIPFNLYHRCKLKLVWMTMYSEVISFSGQVIADTVEIRSLNGPSMIFYGNQIVYVLNPITQFKQTGKMNLSFGEVINQAKYVDIEYRISKAGVSVDSIHPDRLQFIFEVSV